MSFNFLCMYILYLVLKRSLRLLNGADAFSLNCYSIDRIRTIHILCRYQVYTRSLFNVNIYFALGTWISESFRIKRQDPS